MMFQLFSENYNKYYVLFVICLISLALRVYILDMRWINADEGAHLMDAVLILDGKVPSIDFSSRQPIYAYTNAAALKFLGISYISGRLLPMTFSVFVGFMVLLMANVLYDRKVAILSASIYWMLPLELINSVVVKTEPLVILLTCLSLYSVILFNKRNWKAWLIIAGSLAATGFYVRQSALIIPVTVFGYLFITYRSRIREIIKYYSFFLLGYMGVIFLVMIFYSRFMSFEKFIMGGMSPFGFLASAGKNLFHLIGISFGSISDLTSQTPDVLDKSNNLYYRYIQHALKLHFFLLIGVGFSFVTFSRHVFSGTKLMIKEHLDSYSLLYLWLFSLSIAYAYYFYAEAFYIDYFREFLPPLVIIFSSWLRYELPYFDRYEMIERFVVVGLCISAILFFAAPYLYEFLGKGAMVCLSVALFTLFYFTGALESTTRRLVFWSCTTALVAIIVLSRQAPLELYLSGIVPKLVIIGIIVFIPWALLKKGTRPTLKKYARFISYVVVLGAFVFSLTHSANRLTIKYDSNWSPSALEKTSTYLMSHTHPTDSVMSGAVIWELQAQRRPFLGISHPLVFEHRISNDKREYLEAALREDPPEAIVLDSFTEKTYFRQIPWLWNLLNLRYNLVHTAEQARQPVKVYQQKGKPQLE